MPTPRKPQDHKSKVKAYPFVGADGGDYFLPAPTEAIGNIPGRLLRDAIMSDDDNAQARLTFAVLEAANPDPAALDALYSLPVPRMLEIVGDWFTKAKADGVSVPS